MKMYFSLFITITIFGISLKIPETKASRWGCECKEKCRPKIKVLQIDPPHENFPVDPETSWKNHAVKAFENSHPVIECSSATPITWSLSIDGNGPVTVNQKISFGNFSDDKTYCHTSTLTVHSMSREHIGKYLCQDVLNENSYSSLQLYLLSDKEDEEAFYLNAGNSLRINLMEYQLLFPCPASRPSEKFILQNIDGWRSKTIEATYIPHAGFLIDEIVWKIEAGKYRCAVIGHEKEEGYSVNIQVLPSEDFYVSPLSSSIYAKENITIKCSSTDVVSIEMDNPESLKGNEVIYTTDPSNQHPFTATLNMDVNNFVSEGKIRCLRRNKMLIKEWHFRKVEHQGISYDEENNLIYCKSMIADKPPSVTIVACESPEICDSYKKTLNPNKLGKVIAENIMVTYSCGENCIQISVERKAGKVGYFINCSVDDTDYLDTFFIGLDDRIYTKVENISSESVITLLPNKISDSESEEKFTAECKWLPYIFSDNAFWISTSKSGEFTVIDKKFSVISLKNGVKMSTINYPIRDEDVSIGCYAGLRSATEWGVVFHTFPPKSQGFSKSVFLHLMIVVTVLANSLCAAFLRFLQTQFQRMMEKFVKKKTSSPEGNSIPSLQTGNDNDNEETELTSPELNSTPVCYENDGGNSDLSDSEEQETERTSQDRSDSSQQVEHTAQDQSQLSRASMDSVLAHRRSQKNIVSIIRYHSKNLPYRFVREECDQFALIALLIIGIASDVLSEKTWKPWESPFFYLAMSLIFVVTQADHFFLTYEIHTFCGLVLAINQISRTIYTEYVKQTTYLPEEFTAIYVILAVIASSEMFSTGTTLVYFFYLSCNLWLSNNQLMIFTLLIAVLWQRRKTPIFQHFLKYLPMPETMFWFASILVLAISISYEYFPKAFKGIFR